MRVKFLRSIGKIAFERKVKVFFPISHFRPAFGGSGERMNGIRAPYGPGHDDGAR